jgi:hypothetical protein
LEDPSRGGAGNGMSFEQVSTEYAYGKYAGTDYGSKIRVLMRSPKAVLFTGYGVNLVHRGQSGYDNTRKIAEAAKRADLSVAEVRAKIVAAFGEGADDAAILAATTRGRGTILVDGGGDKLPLPRVEASKIYYERYNAVTPTADKLIPVPKKCRQCGSDLKPWTINNHLARIPVGDHPRTIEDCQRLTNYPVFSVHGMDANSDEDRWPFIQWFTTWDGETYHDDTFCNNHCASIYGRRAAAELPALEVGGTPPIIPRKSHESVQHYESPPTHFTKSGLKY